MNEQAEPVKEIKPLEHDPATCPTCQLLDWFAECLNRIQATMMIPNDIMEEMKNG